jgi:hypothetical protein
VTRNHTLVGFIPLHCIVVAIRTIIYFVDVDNSTVNHDARCQPDGNAFRGLWCSGVDRVLNTVSSTDKTAVQGKPDHSSAHFSNFPNRRPKDAAQDQVRAKRSDYGGARKGFYGLLK